MDSLLSRGYDGTRQADLIQCHMVYDAGREDDLETIQRLINHESGLLGVSEDKFRHARFA